MVPFDVVIEKIHFKRGSGCKEIFRPQTDRYIMKKWGKRKQDIQVDYEALYNINRTGSKKKFISWQRTEHRGSTFERIIIGTCELLNVEILFS